LVDELNRSRGDTSSRVTSSTPQTSRSDEFNNNASSSHETAGKNYIMGGLGVRRDENNENIDRRGSSVDRPLNLEMHSKRSTAPIAVDRPMSGSSENIDDRDSGEQF
jgi:hypothetical protein